MDFQHDFAGQLVDLQTQYQSAIQQFRPLFIQYQHNTDNEELQQQFQSLVQQIQGINHQLLECTKQMKQNMSRMFRRSYQTKYDLEIERTKQSHYQVEYQHEQDLDQGSDQMVQDYKHESNLIQIQLYELIFRCGLLLILILRVF